MIVACCVIIATLGIVRTGWGDSDIDKDAESPNVGTWAAKVLESEGVEYDVEEALGVMACTFNADDTVFIAAR